VLDRSTGDYVTANLSLQAAEIWRHWDLGFTVYNVSGETWSDPKNFGQIDSVPRSAVLRATLDF
jgi:hypothetical protein